MFHVAGGHEIMEILFANSLRKKRRITSAARRRDDLMTHDPIVFP